jgi:hypothetical protein
MFSLEDNEYTNSNSDELNIKSFEKSLVMFNVFFYQPNT